jgi:hypothetical protein
MTGTYCESPEGDRNMSPEHYFFFAVFFAGAFFVAFLVHFLVEQHAMIVFSFHQLGPFTGKSRFY